MIESLAIALSTVLLVVSIGVFSILLHGLWNRRKVTVEGWPALFLFFGGPVLSILVLLAAST